MTNSDAPHAQEGDLSVSPPDHARATFDLRNPSRSYSCMNRKRPKIKTTLSSAKCLCGTISDATCCSGQQKPSGGESALSLLSRPSHTETRLPHLKSKLLKKGSSRHCLGHEASSAVCDQCVYVVVPKRQRTDSTCCF